MLQPNKLNLLNLNNYTEFILGLSGGLDSVVLLDLLAKHQPKLKISAVYINHKLQDDSDLWAECNAIICKKYNIAYSFYNLNISKQKGESLEERARAERYKVFAQLVNKPNITLVTGHHLNDQAETFLLQLMRGSGPKGLSAMPCMKKFAKGLHLRPLLEISRKELFEYAKLHNLSWVDDKTNKELSFDRNYIRHNIIPLLEERWPSAINNIAKSAKYNAQHELLLNNYIIQDYLCCKVRDHLSKELDINKLKLLEHEKLIAIIRYWFADLNYLMPGEKKLLQIINSCIANNNTSNTPEVVVGDVVVTRFKNKLYLLNYNDFKSKHNLVYDYKLGQSLAIKDLGINLSSKFSNENEVNSSHINGIKLNFKSFSVDDINNKISIRFRAGGERCRPVGRGGSVSVKKLLQELNIPPWQRNKVPLLYIGEQIACVLGFKACQPFFCGPDDPGWLFIVE